MKKAELKVDYKMRLKELKDTTIVLMIIILILLLGIIYMGWDDIKQKDKLDIFYENLETIQDNCGSTFIIRCMSLNVPLISFAPLFDT